MSGKNKLFLVLANEIIYCYHYKDSCAHTFKYQEMNVRSGPSNMQTFRVPIQCERGRCFLYNNYCRLLIM